MYMLNIGENMKEARRNAGLTQKEVEAKLGLRDLALKDFETERLKLPAELALKFSKLYHVSVDELLGGKLTPKKENLQKEKLAIVESLFARGELEFMFLDPVIRAFLEEYSDKIMESSIFDILTLALTERQKQIVTAEIVKAVGSLMGIDYRVTEEELDFFTRLTLLFKFDDQSKVMTKSLSVKSLPEITNFFQRPSLRHFLLWTLFFVAKSDGVIDSPELDYIEECADALKIHRSHFLAIKRYFVRDIH